MGPFLCNETLFFDKIKIPAKGSTVFGNVNVDVADVNVSQQKAANIQVAVQLLLNFVAALILLRLTVWLQRTFLPRKDLPGLRKLDSRYES